MRKSPCIFLFLLTLLLGQLIFLFSKTNFIPGQVAGTNNQSASTTMSASIGEYKFILFGYTSPKALVTIEGMGIYDQTYANEKGYFEFNNRFSPFSPREAYLTARDQLGRLSFPVFLPPFPTNYNINIGPVIMPPTISLDKKDYWIGNEILLAGQTIPNTVVNLSTFIDEKKSIVNYLVKLPLIKSVQAVTFPQIQANSDEKGNFSISIPSSTPEFLRLFTQARYFEENSPKSVTLNLKILPIWIIIINFFISLLSALKPRLMELAIIVEIIILIIYLFNLYLHHDVIARKRALILEEKFPLLREELSIIKRETHPIIEA